jgi:predicted CXXCH cytochrome family protein
VAAAAAGAGGRGPGAGERKADARSTAEAIRRAIVNPARLSRERQMDVCMQCHLETTTSYPITSIRRYGRAPFSYRPGEPLADFALYFDEAPGPRRERKFEFAHAAYGLRKSACFRGSSMTCTTCHNPHDVPRGESAASAYIAVCRSCHASAHSGAGAGGSRCLDCHMPKRRTDDVVRSAMTDHSIPRRPPQGDPLAVRAEAHEGYEGAVVSYYPARLSQGDELYRAVAQVRYSTNLTAGIAQLRQGIERQRPERPEFYFELGVACWKNGRKDDAIRWYGEALRRGEYRPARRALGETLLVAGQLGRAGEVLAPLAAARDSEALGDLGSLYLRQGRLDQARQALTEALSVRPDYPLARNLLGAVEGRLGEKTAAVAAFREAIRIQPDYDTARVNLALVLAGDADYTGAEFQLQQALAANAASADAHHIYGLVLERTGSLDRARAELEAAVRLAPGMALAASDLADVLALQGRKAEAVQWYRRALKLDPQLAAAQLGLARISGK